MVFWRKVERVKVFGIIRTFFNLKSFVRSSEMSVCVERHKGP